MQKALFFAFIALAFFIPPPGSMRLAPTTQPRALILASTQKQYPMLYLDKVTTDLKEAGYNVTFLSSSSISINFITKQLDQFDILIWRTDTYLRGNTTYWYLGQQYNETTYAGAIGIGPIDVSNGMIAVSDAFFSNNFGPDSLAHVKLAILIANMSITIGQAFIAAGVKTTIDFYQTLDAPSSLFDWVTWSLVGYLTTGSTVRDAVYKTIYNYEYAGSLDDSYLPPISFLGNGNLQIV
jgi:hypothetical protein